MGLDEDLLPGAPPAPGERKFGRWITRERLLLGGSYGILFTRYTICTFLSAFFSTYADDHGITPTMSGIVFAAYPAGMAIMSMYAPHVIQRLGTRTAVLAGLGSTAIFTALFGLSPDICGSNGAAVQASFVITYFLNGFLGALAETSCIILVSAKFRDRQARARRSIPLCAPPGSSTFTPSPPSLVSGRRRP